MLKEAALDQISLVIEKLPDPNILNIEDYVDLFAAITRFPNYYGPEQNRLNSILPGYMPFVDEMLFKSLINIPVEVRNNNKMFYDHLLKNRNNLTKFMLVKGDFKYPFGLSTKSIYAYTTIRKKLSELKRIKKNNEFYKNHKTMVLDILNSNDVRSSSFYSQKRIQDIIKNLHSDEMQSYGQLDWLFSFVIFKEAFNLNI